LTPSRGDQLISLVGSSEPQLRVAATSPDHQLIVECAVSHPQLGEDQLSYSHTLQIFSE
jgi:hypothetical protein